jgi:murein DD-endopeptidase MepM/ murein hydrolase activator NlpD
MMSNMFRVFLLLISMIYASTEVAHSANIAQTPFILKFGRGPSSGSKLIQGEVKRGQGLYQALKGVSIDNKEALQIINALSDEVEFSKLKVGDKLEATFNSLNELVEFSFSQNPAEKHKVKKNILTGNWDYKFHEEKTFWYSRMVNAKLSSGTTLQGVLLAQGFSASTVNDIISALMCKVNFRMSARVGDKFTALIQERKFNDQIIETKVLYTSYSGVRAGMHETFQYEDDEKGSTYNAHYSEDGQALIRAGLRYPLSRLHVRSSYGYRRHPVTGRRTMHRGVDLRGRVGKPVHAVASGKVVESTYNKYAGNKIAIKHRDGSTSYYMHLHKRKVKKGAWVRSYQVIGTVGATGRVTGPHLHFGFKKKNGRWMNPLNKRMIATPKLKGEKLARLKEQVAKIRHLKTDLELSEDVRYLLAYIPNLKTELFFSWPDLFAIVREEKELSES